MRCLNWHSWRKTTMTARVVCAAGVILMALYMIVKDSPTPPSFNSVENFSLSNAKLELTNGLCNVGHIDDCTCIMPFEVQQWRELMKTCGVNQTIDKLLDIIPKSTSKIPVEFNEEIVRPLLMSRRKNVESVDDTVTQSRVFYKNPDSTAADSGKCWYFAELDGFKCLPSAIIIGFQRAATRELYEWLALRPDMFGFKPQFSRSNEVNEQFSVETHYFDSLPESEAYHSLQPLRRKQAIGTLEETWATVYLDEAPSLSLQQVLMSRFVFEKTPAYADESDPRLIRKLLPSVKLLAALRDPASRLYSAYWRRCMTLKPGICSVDHFTETIIEPAEKCGLNGIRSVSNEIELKATIDQCIAFFPSGFELRAVLLGFYVVYLKRYQQAFENSSAKLFVLHAETFAESPFAVMSEVEQFLNLPPFDYSSAAKLVRTGYYVVSHQSKALRGKSNKYITYSRLGDTITARIRAIYQQSIHDLRVLRDETKGGDFIQWSRFSASWLP